MKKKKKKRKKRKKEEEGESGREGRKENREDDWRAEREGCDAGRGKFVGERKRYDVISQRFPLLH
jgi:hypothetical protein